MIPVSQRAYFFQSTVINPNLSGFQPAKRGQQLASNVKTLFASCSPCFLEMFMCGQLWQ
jgi:hypothetical protein